MGDDEYNQARLTYIWTIGNGSALKDHIIADSPKFTAQSMDMTRWSLRIMYTPGEIFVDVVRCGERNGPEHIEIDFELAMLSSHELPLIMMRDTKVFLRGSCNGFPLIESDEVFYRRKEKFLPKDILTVRCRMWNKGIGTSNPDVLFACTHLREVRECHSFIWIVKDFSSLKLGETRTKQVRPMSLEGVSQLATTLFTHRDSDGEEYVCIDISHEGFTDAYVVVCRILLLDTRCAVAHSKKMRLIIDQSPQIILDSLKFLKIKDLLLYKDTLLPGDILTLRCEFECYGGNIWSIIKDYKQSKSSPRTYSISELREMSVEEANDSATEICPFTDVLYKFYQDEILTDVVLQTSTESFHAHRVVLCCRSQVFSVMFSEDMNAKTIKCIDVIENADTMSRLLLYIYTNEVQEMQWQSAIDLFKAACKYYLLDLKMKCSTVLISNISVDTFCSLLSIADRYDEKVLLDKVLDFMSQNLDIFKSDEWGTFKREKPQLALDTTERIIYRNR